MHEHTSISERDQAHTGCVAPYRGAATPCEPAAHGGITRIETCSCGAQRRLNLNGGHREEGAWRGPLVYRLITKRDAEWVGMAASVAGGWVAVHVPLLLRYGWTTDYLLMAAPEGSGLAGMGWPAADSVVERARPHLERRGLQ